MRGGKHWPGGTNLDQYGRFQPCLPVDRQREFAGATGKLAELPVFANDIAMRKRPTAILAGADRHLDDMGVIPDEIDRCICCGSRQSDLARAQDHADDIATTVEPVQGARKFTLVGTDDIAASIDDNLRCPHSVVAQSAGVFMLSLGESRLGKTVLPAQIIPVSYLPRQSQHVRSTCQCHDIGIGRRAG